VKWLDDIIISTFLIALDLVIYECLGADKKNRDHIGLLTDLFCNSKTIFYRHHNIKKADIEFILIKMIDSLLAIGTSRYHITLVFQCIFNELPEIFIIFC